MHRSPSTVAKGQRGGEKLGSLFNMAHKRNRHYDCRTSANCGPPNSTSQACDKNAGIQAAPMQGSRLKRAHFAAEVLKLAFGTLGVGGPKNPENPKLDRKPRASSLCPVLPFFLFGSNHLLELRAHLGESFRE